MRSGPISSYGASMHAFHRGVIWLPCAGMFGAAFGLAVASVAMARGAALVPATIALFALGVATVMIALILRRRCAHSVLLDRD